MIKNMTNKIGIGIIGCGRWGQNLIRVFNGLSEARLVICCNKSNNGQLDQLKSMYPYTETTHNVADVLTNSRVDAVVVVTPDQTHFDISMKAIEVGKHVFVEKPLALSFDEAKEMISFAKSKGKILMTGQIMLYHPAIKWIKERLATGPMNPVSILSTRIDFGVARADADLLWSLATHDVSIIQYLLGNSPEEVHALRASINDKRLGDMLFVNLTFPSGVIGHINAGFAGPHRERRLVLHTTREIVVFDGLTGNLELFARKDSKVGGESGIREYGKQFEAGHRVELVNAPEPLIIECQHFLDCIKTNMAPLSGGENALSVMRTLDKIESAIKSAKIARGE